MSGLTLALVMLLAWAPPLRAAEEPIEADRPDQTDGPNVIPPRAVQLEMGWTRDRGSGVTSHSVGEGLLRVGLTPRLELRAELPTWFVTSDGTATRRGLGDAGVGAKLLLAEASGPRPRLGMEASVEAPSGDAAFRAGGTGFAGLLAAERDVGPLDVSGNLGASRLDPDGRFGWTGAASVSIGFDLSKRTGGYVEWYAEAPRSAAPRHFADAGVSYLVTSRFIVDARAGGGLGNVHESFFGGGGAWRW